MSRSPDPAPNEMFTSRDYTKPINFHSLALANADFAHCLSSNGGKVDFRDPEHQRALTKALLLHDFKLQLFLPENRLCPPVPIRYLYVQWLSALLSSTDPSYGLPTSEKPTAMTGLDIGVGASCIYPLLLATLHPTWHLYGTELDGTNYEYAVHNVAANGLSARITLSRSLTAEAALIPLDRLGVPTLAFTMCNPPFYGSDEELRRTFGKAQGPRGECTGAEVEMITEGGEVGYISRMIEESLVLLGRVRWYTVQLGRWGSVGEVVGRLRDKGCSNWVVSVLKPAGQTVRWVVGWSWRAERASDGVGRHASLGGKGVMPEPGESIVATRLTWDPSVLIHETLSGLARKRMEIKKDGVVVLLVDLAVWSRQERRRREREVGDHGSVQQGEDELARREVQDFAYAFAVSVREVARAEEDQTLWTCTVRWLKGANRTVFESFCGMLQRKIREQADLDRQKLEKEGGIAWNAEVCYERVKSG